MAASPAILFLFIYYFTLASGYTLLRDDDKEIIWPTEYHFKGEELDFITTRKENFEVWYHGDLNRSRIDLYDGTVKKWYYADTDTVFMIHPITNEQVTNEEECIAKSSEEEQLDFLPDVADLTYSGQTVTLYDKEVELWTYTDESTSRSLYVYKTSSGYDLPVQEETKDFISETGQLTSHIIKNFFGFSDTVSEEDVTVEDEDACKKQDLGKDFHKDMKFFHPHVPSELDMAFDLYTNHHNKLYQDEEHQMRKKIFEKKWRMVEEHNRKNLGFRVELNKFSDNTDEEQKHLRGTFVSKEKYPDMQPFPHTLSEVNEIVQDLPEEFDLRIEGAVTPVKDQSICGSCWAFCTTAAVEGALARVNGERLLDLSEQSLVDCAWGYDSFGCDGGNVKGAMNYVLDHGVPTEMDYGLYTAYDGYCKIQNMSSPYKIRGFAEVTPRNADAMKVALFKYGPVSVGIYSSELFLSYSSGVFYDFSCDEDHHYAEHCVTVVGYGVRDGQEYWLVKNSYGENWGEDGYILMSAKNNNCFVLDWPYYPIV